MACIFLVHEDASLKTSITPALEELGHDVFTFSSGLEAETACRALVPDLVIADIDLPKNEGSGFWRRLKWGEQKSAILALSPSDDLDLAWLKSVGKASSLGAAVLMLPLDLGALKSKVLKLLGKS